MELVGEMKLQPHHGSLMGQEAGWEFWFMGLALKPVVPIPTGNKPLVPMKEFEYTAVLGIHFLG